MANGKIELKLGSFSFTGEGEEAWLSKQIDKVLEKLNQLHKVAVIPAVPLSEGGGQNNDQPNEMKNVTLANYLKTKGATSNQTKKFLATAAWLQLRGTNRLSTSDVTKALSSNNQGKLKNPSDCLNKNVKKGHCEKDGNQFYVTDEGLSSL